MIKREWDELYEFSINQRTSYNFLVDNSDNTIILVVQ